MNLIDSFMLGKFHKDIPSDECLARCKVTLDKLDLIKIKQHNPGKTRSKSFKENKKLVKTSLEPLDCPQNDPPNEIQIRLRHCKVKLKKIGNRDCNNSEKNPISRNKTKVIKCPTESNTKTKNVKLKKSFLTQSEDKENQCSRKRKSIESIFETCCAEDISNNSCRPRRSCKKEICYKESIGRPSFLVNNVNQTNINLQNASVLESKTKKSTNIIIKAEKVEDKVQKSSVNKLKISEQLSPNLLKASEDISNNSCRPRRSCKKDIFYKESIGRPSFLVNNVNQTNINLQNASVLESKTKKSANIIKAEKVEDKVQKSSVNKLKISEQLSPNLLKASKVKQTKLVPCKKVKESPKESKKVITAKRGTLKYLKEREIVLQNQCHLKEENDVFSTSFSKKLCKKPLYDLLECDMDDSLTIKTPKGKHENGDISAMTPRTALLNEWEQNIVTPSSLPISPRPTTKVEQKQGALEVLYHHLKKQPMKNGRKKNLSSPAVKNLYCRRKISQELPFLPDMQQMDIDSSFDDYFNESL